MRRIGVNSALGNLVREPGEEMDLHSHFTQRAILCIHYPALNLQRYRLHRFSQVCSTAGARNTFTLRFLTPEDASVCSTAARFPALTEVQKAGAGFSSSHPLCHLIPPNLTLTVPIALAFLSPCAASCHTTRGPPFPAHAGVQRT